VPSHLSFRLSNGLFGSVYRYQWLFATQGQADILRKRHKGRAMNGIIGLLASPAGRVFPAVLGNPGSPLSLVRRIPMEVAPIKYEEDGRHHRVQLGDFAEIELEDFVPPQNPGGDVYQLTNLFHPVNSTLNIVKDENSRFKGFGYEFSHAGKFANSATFSWAG
jgi:hypothetical protein